MSHPITTLARVALRRMRRGRGLIIATAVLALPVAFAFLLTRQVGDDATGNANKVFAFEQLALAVLAALLVASPLGEDIEDRSATYVWSRPVPRWNILAAILLAAVPVIWLLSTASWLIAHRIASGGLPTPASCLALIAVGGGFAIVASAIAVLAPRYAMALTIVYTLFFDAPLGSMPSAIQNVSLEFHGRTIAELGIRDPTVPAANPLPAIAMIAGLWLIVALWKVRRLEP